MSYSAVPTVSTGDVWSAANHNIYVRENFMAIAPDIITAKGQLIVGTGAGAGELLTVGTDGQYLTANSTGPGWNTLSTGSYGHIIPFYVNETTSWQNLAAGSANVCMINQYSGLPAGVKAILVWGSFRADITTAYFQFMPSYDTTQTCFYMSYLNSTFVGSYTGIIPLDSTGGCWYTKSDTTLTLDIGIYAYITT